MARFGLWVALVGLAIPLTAQRVPTAREFAAAAKNIRRLRPAAFPQLPPAFARTLERLGCMIPQPNPEQIPRGDAPMNNVIHGAFARQGDADWAAVCSRRGQSRVRIYWSHDRPCPVWLPGTFRDADFLQGWGDGRIVYSFSIAAVSERQLRGYPPPVPLRLTHQAIDAGFLGKASTVWYCKQGRWQSIAGAD